MRITESKLKRIIREELKGILISERSMQDIGGDLGAEANKLIDSNESKMLQLIKLAIDEITGDDPPCPDLGECLASLLTYTLEDGGQKWIDATNRAIRSNSNKEMINTLIHFLRKEALDESEAEKVRTMFINAGLYDDDAHMSGNTGNKEIDPDVARRIYRDVQKDFKDKSVSDIEKEIEGIKELVDRGIDEDPANKVQHKALMALLYYQTNGERGISGEVPPGYEMNKNWGKDPEGKS
tara:strand:+ start:1227 stop:1943 length:717 start_codon:yes stop_codon:yes gene_type:complete